MCEATVRFACLCRLDRLHVHSSSVLSSVLSRLSIYCVIWWLGNSVSFPVALFGVCTCSWRSGAPVFSSVDFVRLPFFMLHVVSYLDLRTGPC